jgi:DNA-binding MarR family transcriptional regulator
MANWLDDDEMRAWRGLVEVGAEVRAALESDLSAAFDLTEGDYAVLVLLSEAPDRRLRMCDLAHGLHLTPGGLTRRLDGLVARGVVVREASSEDRRVVMAVLTDEGMALLEQAAPVHVEGVRRHLLDHWDRGQIRAVADAFDAARARRREAGLEVIAAP